LGVTGKEVVWMAAMFCIPVSGTVMQRRDMQGRAADTGWMRGWPNIDFQTQTYLDRECNYDPLL
jgi:hypothetical protein